MSHEQQIIRALRSAIADYKKADLLHKHTINLQREALSQLKTVIVQLVPRTDFTDEEKALITENLGTDIKPKLVMVKDAN